MCYLPTELKTIVLKYNQELLMNDVLIQLKQKFKYCHSCCSNQINYDKYCDNDFCSYCNKYICNRCYDFNIFNSYYLPNVCGDCQEHYDEEYFEIQPIVHTIDELMQMHADMLEMDE